MPTTNAALAGVRGFDSRAGLPRRWRGHVKLPPTNGDSRGPAVRQAVEGIVRRVRFPDGTWVAAYASKNMSSKTQQKRDLIDQFDLTVTIFVNTVPQAHLEGVTATMKSYSGFIQENLQQAGPVSPQTFVSWIRSADRNPEDLPEPWAAELVKLFDGLLIAAIEELNIDPHTAAASLDQWVTESLDDLQEVHDLPEGFFDV